MPRAGDLHPLVWPEPCGMTTEGLPQCLLALALARILPTETLLTRQKAPPYCCKLGEGAHMRHMGAHAR